jgi:hypothetical protein
MEFDCRHGASDVIPGVFESIVEVMEEMALVSEAVQRADCAQRL